VHEELKQFYVPQYNKSAAKGLKGDGDWTDTMFKTTSHQNNQEQLFTPSLVRDIFGGVLRTEFHVQNSKQISTTTEPFFVVNLEIPKHATTI
jgi:hypothetical protein